jgi:hypothetical protein
MKKILYCIRKVYKSVASIFFFILIIESLYSQSIKTFDYREIFGEQYRGTVNYLNQNWITDSLKKHNINPCFAKSIVFPELIRYSSIKDKLETHGLYTLYIQFGEAYANFSIGHFQMKPGFAELVEKDVYAMFPLEKEWIGIDTSHNPKARLERVRRLDNPLWQVKYLIWFIKVAEKQFANMHWKTSEDKLIFYATAYNCGYDRSPEYIQKMTHSNYYHTSLFKSSTCYNYADISLSFWEMCINTE